jgi:hypothetical protein
LSDKLGVVVKVVVVVAALAIVAIIVGGLWEWGSINFGSLFSPSSVLIAYDVPPYGSTGGTYRYRATLATPTYGGELDAGATISKIVIRVPTSTSVGDPQTTTTGYTATSGTITVAAGSAQVVTVDANAVTARTNPVDLSYVAGTSDTAFTEGTMTITIEYPYTFMYAFDAHAQVTYVEPVPVPYNPLVSAPSITGLPGGYLLDQGFISQEEYDAFFGEE